MPHQVRRPWFPDPKLGVLDYLDACTGTPWHVIWAAMEQEFNKRFVDYGVSLRLGYATLSGCGAFPARCRQATLIACTAASYSLPTSSAT